MHGRPMSLATNHNSILLIRKSKVFKYINAYISMPNITNKPMQELLFCQKNKILRNRSKASRLSVSVQLEVRILRRLR